MGRKSINYWKSVNNAINEAREIMNKYQLDVLPSSDGLKRIRKGGLVESINKYHGGFHKFRRLLGQQPIRRKHNTWESLEYTLEEAKKVISENSLYSLPNSDELARLGYSSLCYAITKYHGGFNNFRGLLDEKLKKRKEGIWKDLGFTLKYAKNLMEENGWEELPSSRKLKKINNSSLASAINRYHGGLMGFRRILGQEQKRKESNYWKKLENVLAEAKKAIGKEGLNELPSARKLRNLGYSSLANAISVYYGFPKIRKKLGEKEKRKSSGYWKNLEFVLNYSKGLMKKNKWSILPDAKNLRKRGLFGLCMAINRYHGGFPVFRTKLNQYLGKKSEREQLEELLRRYIA